MRPPQPAPGTPVESYFERAPEPHRPRPGSVRAEPHFAETDEYAGALEELARALDRAAEAFADRDPEEVQRILAATVAVALANPLTRPDLRGNANTVEGDRIVAQICNEVFARRFGWTDAGMLQRGGSRRRGLPLGVGEYLEQETIRNRGNQRRFRRPDYSAGDEGEYPAGVINTVDVNASGNITPREFRAIVDLQQATRGVVHFIPKRRPGDPFDDARFRRDAEDACEDIANEIERRRQRAARDRQQDQQRERRDRQQRQQRERRDGQGQLDQPTAPRSPRDPN